MVTEERTGEVGMAWMRRWKAVTERRFALPSGHKVEAVVAHSSWAATELSEGTRQVVTDYVSRVYDPKAVLAGLLDICGRSKAAESSRGLEIGHA
jgi:hypothetical protein